MTSPAAFITYPNTPQVFVLDANPSPFGARLGDVGAIAGVVCPRRWSSNPCPTGDAEEACSRMRSPGWETQKSLPLSPAVSRLGDVGAIACDVGAGVKCPPGAVDEALGALSPGWETSLSPGWETSLPTVSQPTRSRLSPAPSPTRPGGAEGPLASPPSGRLHAPPLSSTTVLPPGDAEEARSRCLPLSPAPSPNRPRDAEDAVAFGARLGDVGAIACDVGAIAYPTGDAEEASSRMRLMATVWSCIYRCEEGSYLRLIDFCITQLF